MSSQWDEFGLVGSPSWHACKQAHAEIERLRIQVKQADERGDDALRRAHAAEAEIERLTGALKKANDQAEHFEREWYLRGDEIELLRADAERLKGGR